MPFEFASFDAARVCVVGFLAVVGILLVGCLICMAADTRPRGRR